MNRTLEDISDELELREPQHESLKILADVVKSIELSKTPDLQASLETIQGLYPSVKDFERGFPSLCFALATGVGKTRLMGAFISYLYLTGDSRNFFVLAPNLTIYEKLKREFQSKSDPKYVFKGIAEFVSNPPMVITGESYNISRSVRLLTDSDIPCIHIFNISKINATDNKQGTTKSQTSRVRRFQETIGESYFDYLASQPDLVMLMDEAHHYHATASAAAIDELKPILGIELTATPKTVGVNSVAFKNIIYGYTLAKALRDGYVKRIAAFALTNFRPKNYEPEELDHIKLKDGVRYHEHTKAELKKYADDYGRKLVTPFMLVVAQGTAHADELYKFIASKDFRDGKYEKKVVVIHSNQPSVEEDENIQRLISIEKEISIEEKSEQTEIVIHVNKLKEGWDVANLYTIVPLRASASEILTEQTIGRGLRLPYGSRTGVRAVDMLTIVAHDKYQDIVDRANDPDSIIHNVEIINPDEDASFKNPHRVDVPSLVSLQLTRSSVTGMATIIEKVLDTPLEQKVAEATLKVLEQQRELKSTQELLFPEIQAKIAEEVFEMIEHEPGIGNAMVKAIVKKVAEKLPELTIEIPNLVLSPSKEGTYGFSDFDLKDLDKIRFELITQERFVKDLQTNERIFISWDGKDDDVQGKDLRDYIIPALRKHNGIDYDGHADLLYKLVGQVVDYSKSYLKDESEVRRVLAYYQKEIVEFIFEQLEEHTWETPSDGRRHDFRGFVNLKPLHYVIQQGAKAEHFRSTLKNKRDVRKIVFHGFKKCCYPLQKFDSVEGEQRFAQVLEDSESVERWMKPAPRAFQIEYDSGTYYEPDFIVKTADAKYLCEPKMKKEMESATVIAKRNAAVEWCRIATRQATKNGGTPWHYALIPHDEIDAASDFKDLMNKFVVSIEAIE